MSGPQTAVAVVLTVLALATVLARQVAGLSEDRAAPRWLTLLAGACVLAFFVAMALRLSTAL